MLISPLLAYRIKSQAKPLGRGITQPRRGSVDAVIKDDGEEAPTCVYNEFVAERLANLLNLPVAKGVLGEATEGFRYASLIAASRAIRLPEIDARQAKKVAERYPNECAALLVFDIFIGNWDRAGNVKAVLSAASPFFCAYDHSHSLLSASRTPEESIADLHDAKPIMSTHLFLHEAMKQYIGPWKKRVEQLRPQDIYACCCPGMPVNDVLLDTQERLAKALVSRRTKLSGIVSGLYARIGPSER